MANFCLFAAKGNGKWKLASSLPPLESFILLLRGILEYRDSQHAGAILADETPVSFHCYLVAEISIFRLKWKHKYICIDIYIQMYLYLYIYI